MINWENEKRNALGILENLLNAEKTRIHPIKSNKIQRLINKPP